MLHTMFFAGVVKFPSHGKATLLDWEIAAGAALVIWIAGKLFSKKS